MVEYPVELRKGDDQSESNPLAKCFKEFGWETDWDFSGTDYWYDVLYKGKTIMQVEFPTTPEDLVNTIKGFVPALAGQKTFNKASLEVIDRELTGRPLYIYDEKNPSRYAQGLKEKA